jgi:hypothetical protein
MVNSRRDAKRRAPGGGGCLTPTRSERPSKIVEALEPLSDKHLGAIRAMIAAQSEGAVASRPEPATQPVRARRHRRPRELTDGQNERGRTPSEIAAGAASFGYRGRILEAGGMRMRFGLAGLVVGGLALSGCGSSGNGGDNGGPAEPDASGDARAPATDAGGTSNVRDGHPDPDASHDAVVNLPPPDGPHDATLAVPSDASLDAAAQTPLPDATGEHQPPDVGPDGPIGQPADASQDSAIAPPQPDASHDAALPTAPDAAASMPPPDAGQLPPSQDATIEPPLDASLDAAVSLPPDSGADAAIVPVAVYDGLPDVPVVDGVAHIGPYGGHAIFEDGIEVDVPPGAVQVAFDLTAHVAAPPAELSPPEAPALGAIQLGPEGLVFAVPVRLRLPRPLGADGLPLGLDAFVLVTDEPGEILGEDGDDQDLPDNWAAVVTEPAPDGAVYAFHEHFSSNVALPLNLQVAQATTSAQVAGLTRQIRNELEQLGVAMRPLSGYGQAVKCTSDPGCQNSYVQSAAYDALGSVLANGPPDAKLQVNSAWRSIADQRAVQNQNANGGNITAQVVRSNHGSGLALDLQGIAGKKMLAACCEAFGYVAPGAPAAPDPACPTHEALDPYPSIVQAERLIHPDRSEHCLREAPRPATFPNPSSVVHLKPFLVTSSRWRVRRPWRSTPGACPGRCATCR